MVTPDGAEWAPRPRVDNAMVKAPARAFRWRKILDAGVHATLEDLAQSASHGRASGNERTHPFYLPGRNGILVLGDWTLATCRDFGPIQS